MKHLCKVIYCDIIYNCTFLEMTCFHIYKKVNLMIFCAAIEGRGGKEGKNKERNKKRKRERGSNEGSKEGKKGFHKENTILSVKVRSKNIYSVCQY